MVIGVAERALGHPFALSLKDAGVQRALVVCGAEGLDEISCAGDTYAWDLNQGTITEKILSPTQFGLSTHPLSSVKGGDSQVNAETFKTLLTSGAEIPGALEPVLDFVLMNASALLVVAGLATDWEEGVELARESVVKGKAWKALQTFREAGELLAAAKK